jgi:hypothetical protein
MVTRPTYTLGHLPDLTKDLAVLKSMYLEYYQFHFPLLEYMVLDVDASESESFYGDMDPDDRTFLQPHSALNLHYDLVSAEYLKERFGIDRKSEHLFRACQPQLDTVSIVPKTGDRIVFDGNQYEIDTVKRNPESFFGHTNYAFELLLTADVGNPLITTP